LTRDRQGALPVKSNPFTGRVHVYFNTNARRKAINPSTADSATRRSKRVPRSQESSDRLAFIIASALVLAIIVYARRFVDPFKPTALSYQCLALCLLAVAIAGRALLGYRARETDPGNLALPARVVWPVLIVAAVLPYLQTLRVSFLSDDYGLLAAMHAARSPLDALHSDAFVTFYRPLTLLLWWLGDRLWHGAPLGYHALSLILHALNALLVYGLGRRLTASAYAGFMAALLFAVHPLHVEPVTWLAASADLLCATFAVSSLLLLEVGLTTPAPSRQRFAFAGALTAFLLALLSKEAALALPGFVALRGALVKGPRRTRRAITLGAAYSVVLIAYLALRSAALGGVGGYRMPLSVWNTVFPSAEMLMLGDFLFPVHRTLFSSALGPIMWPAALVLMAGAALWWLLGLERVPADRLWLWLGFFLLTAVPAWVFLWRPSASLEWTRFAYLPTIGLAWLFGDICFGRGPTMRSSGAVAGAIIIAFAALTVWYVTPWRQAGRMGDSALKGGVRLVGELYANEGRDPTLYVSDLPEAWYGAPIFTNCYPQALNLAIGRPLAIWVVSARQDRALVHPETMAASVLSPGEHLVRWDSDARRFDIVRTGGPRP